MTKWFIGGVLIGYIASFLLMVAFPNLLLTDSLYAVILRQQLNLPTGEQAVPGSVLTGAGFISVISGLIGGCIGIIAFKLSGRKK